MNTNNTVLGFDIGGVIIDGGANDGTDTAFFSENFLATTPVPGALEALEVLHTLGFEIHLISKCYAKTERKSRLWLAHHKIEERAGITSAHLHFCEQRSGKAAICARLGVTHFVDDRLEIVGQVLKGIVPHRMLINAKAKEIAQFRRFLPGVIQLQNLAEVVQLVTA